MASIRKLKSMVKNSSPRDHRIVFWEDCGDTFVVHKWYPSNIKFTKFCIVYSKYLETVAVPMYRVRNAHIEYGIFHNLVLY